MNKKTKHKIRSLKYALNRRAFAIYSFCKYNHAIWRLLNWSAIKNYRKEKPELNTVQQRILEGLETDGIAVASLHEFFPGENMLAKLQEYVAKRKDRAAQNHKKPFLDDLLPEIPELGHEVPFVEIALSPTILNIVNSYMGLHSQLYHFMLRRTRKCGNKLPMHSQNWHRAPQERKNCRVYIYLSEVSETSGPFIYIPQSTHNKKYGDVAAQTAFTRGYNSAEVVAAAVPEKDIKTIAGPAGTVIFCDSTGLHRGGYSAVDTRTMSTFGYGAPSFRENIHYSYSKAFRDSLEKVSSASQAALNPRWMR